MCNHWVPLSARTLSGFGTGHLDWPQDGSPQDGSSVISVHSTRTLESSLVLKPTWNRRGDFRFLSIRKWSVAHRQETAELRRRKDGNDRDLMKFAAADIAVAITATFAHMGDVAVVPAPRGRSTGPHFATEVAKAVAKRVGGRFYQAFAPCPKTTRNITRGVAEKADVRVQRMPAESIVLCVDDVATTVATLRACAGALKGRFVIPVAWIYSDSREAGPREPSLTEWGA